MVLEASLEEPEICALRIQLERRGGGLSHLDLRLPQGVEVVGPPLRAEVRTAPGETRSESVRLWCAAGAHKIVAVVATIDGVPVEGFVEFGERPNLEARGARVRRDSEGDTVLRP